MGFGRGKLGRGGDIIEVYSHQVWFAKIVWSRRNGDLKLGNGQIYRPGLSVQL